MVAPRRRGRLGCKDDEDCHLCTTEGEAGDILILGRMMSCDAERAFVLYLVEAKLIPLCKARPLSVEI